MLCPYLFVIGLIKLPPSDAKVKVTFPKKPISLSYISSFRCHCQGAADAVYVSSKVTAIAVHNTLPPGDLLLTLRVNSPCFFIIFHLLNLYLPFGNTNISQNFSKVYEGFSKVLFFD